MRVFASPRRTARASPCPVLASPWQPAKRRRARWSAGPWSPTTTALLDRPFDRQSAARSQRRPSRARKQKEAAVRHGALRPQELAARALRDVVPGVVAQAPHRSGAADRLGPGSGPGAQALGRGHRRDLAPLEAGAERGPRAWPASAVTVSIAAPVVAAAAQGAGRERLALVRLARGDLDLEDDAARVADHRVLLAAGLQAAGAPRGGHARVGVGEADLLEAPGLPRAPPPLLGRGVRLLVAAGLADRLEVPHRQALPGDVGADQPRRPRARPRAPGDAHLDAGAGRALEDGADALGAPLLADAGERGVIRQAVAQPVAGEPADRGVDLRLAHQPAVVDDAERRQARPHPADRRLRVGPRAADARSVEAGHLLAPPAQVEHPVDPGEDGVVRNEVPHRAAHQDLERVALRASEHPRRASPALRSPASPMREASCADFSNGPWQPL